MNDTTATTFIGIDVHARSAAACAINGLTGEIERASFGAGYTAAEIAEWALGFDSPAAVYEAGCTGFWLARGLRELGVPCAVGAPSKMQRPPADARKKNDRSDAEFLARLLSMRNVREVAVPDEECEAARDLCRARADAAADLTRARQRLNLFLMRRGHVYCERAAGGSPKASWSRGWWAWMRSLDLGGDSVAFDYYVSEVRHAEAQKRQLDLYVRRLSERPRWKRRVDALRCLKGIEAVTAMTLVAEAAAFARFGSARAYCAWLGLEPSEHSSGGKVARGGITKTGNSLCRRLLVESAWHYSRAGEARKSPKGAEIPLPIENHAAKGVKPGDTYPPGILSAPLPISRHDRTTPYRSRRTPLRQTGRSSWQTSPYQAYRTHRPSQGASCIQILVSSSS